MTRASAARIQRRKQKGGRPWGFVPFMTDPRRFALTVSFTLTEIGFGSHVAACLTAVLINSTEPITIESVQDVLVNISTSFGDRRTTTLKCHSDRLARNVALVFPRCNEEERDWIARSAACIAGLLRFMTDNKLVSASQCLDTLVLLGWGEVIETLRGRISSALQADMPPLFKGDLSVAALGLLSRVKG